MKSIAVLLSFVGLLLCLGAAGTGVYWGVFNKESMLWRDIHLKIAIACVFISIPAHALSIRVLRRPK